VRKKMMVFNKRKRKSE
jgi:hypothetical protein